MYAAGRGRWKLGARADLERYVTFTASPFDRTFCACGCGGDAPTGRSFLPGHDQIAIHDRVKKVGGVLPFMEWFDQRWAESQA